FRPHTNGDGDSPVQEGDSGCGLIRVPHNTPTRSGERLRQREKCGAGSVVGPAVPAASDRASAGTAGPTNASLVEGEQLPYLFRRHAATILTHLERLGILHRLPPLRPVPRDERVAILIGHVGVAL